MAVSIEVDYVGHLHCTATHGPSGSQLETDAPKDNAGRGEAFSPTDLVATALVSCAVTTMGIKAASEGIAFESAKGVVSKVMTSEGPRAIARLEVAFTIKGALDGKARARLEEIAHSCPVALSLAESVQLPMQFSYVEA